MSEIWPPGWRAISTKRLVEIVARAAARLLAALAGIVILSTGSYAAEATACTTGTVASEAGPVCGIVLATGSGKQAQAFLGIPFAESTAKEGRWKPPVPKGRWSETFAAVRYGAICPQTVHRPLVQPAEGGGLNKMRPRGPSAQPPSQSEDCLSLNVWAPAGANPDTKLPVMVFIYGGAFEAGDSADPLYDGAYLAANKNVILVSFNYRLGVLGFLAADGLSGNYGFMDQQLALSWVQKNIAAFGGDPGKVTIFGESAGAMSVGLHVLSAPASAGLFRAAIMESNFFALPYKRLADQVDIGNIFKQGLNCRDVKCLRDADVTAILAAQQAFTPQMSTVFSGAKFYIPFGPAIDGAVLTRQPVHGATGKPILMGTNKNEAVIFVEGEAISPADYSAWAASLFGKAFQKVVARYPARSDSSNSDLWARVQTDNFLICSTRHVASNAKAPVYTYLFNHQPSFKVWGGPACREGDTVCHGDELPFVFHSADKIGGRFTADEERLSNAMMDRWANFAASLDPNGDPAEALGPRWPRFSKSAKNYLVLNVPALSIQTDPYRDACEFWDGIGYSITEPWGRN